MKTLMILLSLVTSTVFAAEKLENPEQVKAAFAKGRPMVIMFYADWCPACQSTKPRYAEAEKALAGKVDFYLMDSDKIRLRMAKDFDGIPAFVAGTSEKDIRSARTLETGGMSTKDLIKYVTKSTGVK